MYCTQLDHNVRAHLHTNHSQYSPGLETSTRLMWTRFKWLNTLRFWGWVSFNAVHLVKLGITCSIKYTVNALGSLGQSSDLGGNTGLFFRIYNFLFSVLWYCLHIHLISIHCVEPQLRVSRYNESLLETSTTDLRRLELL